MNYQQWYERGLDATWRQFAAQEIFNLACSVVMEEASSVRTVSNSIEVNALQNQFREGMFSAIRTLRALTMPKPGPKEALHRPWERPKKEDEEPLPSGPKRPGENNS